MRYCFLRFPKGKDKALTCSYDDGSVHDKRLIEIANRYGIRVTLNINSGFLNMAGRLSAEELKNLVSSGRHELAIHGDVHLALGKVSISKGISDVLLCRQKLEQEFETILRGLAYADSGIQELTAGVTKEEIFRYLSELDIAYGRSLGADNCRFELPQNFYEWIPTAHHANPKMLEYLDLFLETSISDYAANRIPRLFYLWGHSFEFERDNDWELFEQFCQKAGGRDDIWYATNIEICDYVKAYRALRFNVDYTRVFNPNCQPIWFEEDGELYCAEPGKVTAIK